MNDRSVYDNQESYGHDQRNDLRNGERPPYCVKSTDGSKDISCRYQDKQLTHDRYDHAEYSFSECLEYSSRNDTEPCDQIVDSYDTKCRDSDGKHIFGSTEQPQQCFRHKFKGKKTNECKTECDEHADFDSFKHTLSVACTIIIGNNRCNAVVKSKYRHEEKTLQFEVNTKYCSCSDCKLYQDQIHAVGHDRTDGLHDDRWNTYCINMADDLKVRTEAPEAEPDFMIKFMVADSCNDAGYTLSDHSSYSSSGNTHFRSTEQTKDQDRVKDDVGDGTAQLGSHAEYGFSCGCEQTFKEKLSKQTKGEYHNCAQIFNPKFKDLRVCVMYLAGIKWFYYCKSKD